MTFPTLGIFNKVILSSLKLKLIKYLDLDSIFKNIWISLFHNRNKFWWNCLFANATGALSSTRSPAASKVSWDDVAQGRNMFIRLAQSSQRGKATRSVFGKLGPPLADQTFPYKIIQFENFGGISHSTESINEGSTKKCCHHYHPKCFFSSAIFWYQVSFVLLPCFS